MAATPPLDAGQPAPAASRRTRRRRASAPRDAGQPIGTVTFLFSDVVGSVPQFQKRGDRRAREFFRLHDTLIREEAQKHDGHLYRREGDGFFISFRSTREALRCAIAVQRGLPRVYADSPFDGDRPHVRIGIHVGETIEEEGDYYGAAVNIAARVRDAAGPDQILVTGLVRGLASGEPEFRYRFLKDAQLKGVDGTIRLYELLWRREEAAAGESGRAEPAPRPSMAPTAGADAALRDYAASLAEWCVASDLSEWAGRYIPLMVKITETAGIVGVRAGAVAIDLQDCLARYQQIVVAGDSGSGKTTALLEATHRAARLLEADQTALAPVFVQLRMWRPEQDFIELVQETLAARGLVQTREAVVHLLNAGRLLLLLDGLNEVPELIGEAHGLSEIDGLPQRFPLCRLIASTRQVRPGDPLGTLPVAVVQPLRPHDVLQYIVSYTGDPERAERIFRSLGGRNRAAWLRANSTIALARNPLMLNVIIGQELTAGGVVRPSRAMMLQAYTRHLHQVDARRGSRLTAEVKEALLASMAYQSLTEPRQAALDRGDLAQLVRTALTELRAEELVPAGLDVSVVLAEMDRRFLAPLLPDASHPGSYDWSHPRFVDYFAAIELRRRYFVSGRVRDEGDLAEYIAWDSRYRWAGAFMFLGELLDDTGALALLEVCLRADDLVLACRCLERMLAGDPQRWTASPSAAAQQLARLLRGRAGGDDTGSLTLQDPVAVLCEALIERPRADDAAVVQLEAGIGTALFAAAWGVGVPGVLGALTLGLSDAEARAVAWTVGRFAGDVASTRTRLKRLHAVAPVSGPQEQFELRQGLIAALADTPEFVAIELCHRTEELATSERKTAPQRRLLARDTLGVHVPLARRLAFWSLARRLEDLCLQALEPTAFEQAAALSVELRLQRREQRLDWLGDVLGERLQRLGVAADVETEVPNLYRVAAELKHLGERGLPRAALHGIGRVIVNVPDDETAARAFTVIEELWPGVADADPDAVPLLPAPPRPGRRDLIAYPAEGGFVRILLQTVPPDELDLPGASGSVAGREPTRVRMKRLLAGVLRAGDEERVLVVTKRGMVMPLPVGSTPVDFAYHVHTRIGHSYSGALINDKPQPPTYQLRHGDHVEVLDDWDRPLPPVEWLDRPGILHTVRARKAVQQALESARRTDAIEYGREVIEREFERFGATVTVMPRLLRALGFQQDERLYEAIGNGDVARREVAYALGTLLHDEPGSGAAAARSYDGWVPAPADASDEYGGRVRYARCCRPQPGDPIVGYQSGQTVVVHHAECPSGAASAAGKPPIGMRWQSPGDGTALLRVQARRTQPLAPQVRRLAARAGVQIVDLAANRNIEGPLTLTLECRGDDEQLARLGQLISGLPDAGSISVLRD